jgi:dipeptidyl aminopeptidase/acylaminoacyl peptidase
LRPKIIDPDRRVAFPGDEHVDVYRFLSIDLENGATQFAQTVDCCITFMPYVGYFTGHRAWWDKDSRHAYFVEEERGMKAHRLQRLDTVTGTVQTLIEERSDHLAMLIPSTHVTPLYMPLPATDEVIWYSERSGTAHFYLYDTVSGELKNPITQGEWIVRNGLRVDEQRRELTFQTASRVEGRNPYYCDICRVNIDTGELTTVISTDHEYIVCDQRSRISHSGFDEQRAMGVSPSGNYMVTTRSRVDQIPVTFLLDRDGKEVMIVETADVSGLPEGYIWPEPIMLKADDGKTDIYSVVYRPSHFDPEQSYPVLDMTTGYCSPVGSFTNSHAYFYLALWAFAELGFIVVVVCNRGTERLRDKAFNEFIDPRLPADPEQLNAVYNNDCVAGIKQLAERYSYMDLKRVGVAELGHTPRAILGLFLHPEFYRVGVSVNPCFDKRLKCSMGIDYREKEKAQLVEWVDNFNGKLLVIAHLLASTTPVTMTFRLVDALHKANKRFDMLMLPGAGHALVGDEYALQRCWDYLVEHLLGLEPPKSTKCQTG